MSRVYATTVTGLARILEDEATSLGFTPTRHANDGRADVVVLNGADLRRLQHLRTAENVLLALADVGLRSSPAATAGQVDRVALGRALARTGRDRVRLVVRLRDERHFSRTHLRGAIARHLGALITEHDDKSAAELWVLQASRSRLWVGVRHPDLGTRARPGRPAELPGALRPAVAAAMLRLVVGRGAVLDPCSGTGTIAAEATALGRPAVSGDLDWRAVSATVANALREAAPSSVLRLDARHLPFAGDSFAAVVTNLPFGRQHVVQGSPVAWYRRVLSEALRVAPQAVVLAAPTEPFRQALGRLPVSVAGRFRIVLLGNRTDIWVVTR